MTELTSARFRDNAPLQQCANEDAAHLLQGSEGEPVALVQQALIDLGVLGDDADGMYGGNTAAAVKAYKTERAIQAPGAAVDDIVGKLTIAYLDREIQEFDDSSPECFSTGDPLATVDLGGLTTDAPHALLGLFGAGPFVSIGESGEVVDLTGTAADAATLTNAAAAATGVLTGQGDAVALGASLLALAGDPAIAGFPDTVNAMTTPPLALVDLNAPPANIVAALTAAPTSPTTPARDLSKADALAQVAAAHSAREIRLAPDPAVTPPSATSMLSLAAGVVAGITFQVAGSAMRNVPQYSPRNAPLQVLDPRHLLGLIRLCRHLQSTWGVTEIHHAGVNGNTALLAGDCHQGGRACDLVGVRGVRAGAPFLFTVYNDWWQLSVPDDAHPPKRMPDWPHRSGVTRYRLADHPTVDAFRRDFWADVYATIALDFQDRTQGPNAVGAPTTIGAPSSIMTPEHPTSHMVPKTSTKTLPDGTEVKTTAMVAASDGREAHTGHVHFQIGATGRKL